LDQEVAFAVYTKNSNSFMKFLFSFGLLLFSLTTFAQVDSTNYLKKHQINGEIDLLSAALSYNYNITPFFGPGIGAKAGFSFNISITEQAVLMHREHISYFIYNRFQINPSFSLDLGFRYAPSITLVDHNPQHGFSHLSFLGAYLAPMYRWKNFSIGTIIGIGQHRNFSVYFSPCTIRYSIPF
jgi:hypothetical protein